MPVTIATPTTLDAAQRAAVLTLAAAIERADGAPPLSDQARAGLAADAVPGPGVHHLVASDGDRIVGYAYLAGSSAEVAGEPQALDPLLDRLLTAAGAPVEIWAHGSASRLPAVLEARNATRVRLLWQLRRPAGPLPVAAFPADVQVRPFRPGRDEAAWLAVNAAAFTDLPDQGGWQLADLLAREREPWFDPAGFLLAERDGELLGFHWTKRHSPTLGEVYVIAVAPAAQGLHLGTALLIAGLEHLVAGGATEVLLYVDDANTAAIALYEKYGFARYDRDALYRIGGSSHLAAE